MRSLQLYSKPRIVPMLSQEPCNTWFFVLDNNRKWCLKNGKKG